MLMTYANRVWALTISVRVNFPPIIGYNDIAITFEIVDVVSRKIFWKRPFMTILDSKGTECLSSRL